jgi:peptidoglycan/xylan/chitin deacetylase (PgdA/CDA1 family)
MTSGAWLPPAGRSGLHTMSHRALTELSTGDLDYQARRGRAEIEEAMGKDRCVLPYGRHDDRVAAAARRAGCQ